MGKNLIWSVDEDTLMKKHYNNVSISEMMGFLPNRSKQSIRLRANKLKLTKPDWSEKEVSFLKKHFKNETYTWIAEKLDKTKGAVQQKARLIGLQKIKNTKWTDEEINFLKNNFNELTYDQFMKKLDRSLSAIYNKAWELGLSSSEDKYQKLKYNQRLFILNNCYRMSDCELATMFKVSTDAIRDLRLKHGLKKDISDSMKNYNRMSEPERKVKDFLDQLGVDYKYNALLGKYYPDFLLNDKTVIEVQGDYFHCNPSLYPKGPNASQIEYIVKDYYKKCFYESDGISVLYIWENDINKNWVKTKKEIETHCRLVEKSSRA